MIEYGDENCLTTGCYGVLDPKAGATSGLAPGVTTARRTKALGMAFRSPLMPAIIRHDDLCRLGADRSP